MFYSSKMFPCTVTSTDYKINLSPRCKFSCVNIHCTVWSSTMRLLQLVVEGFNTQRLDSILVKSHLRCEGFEIHTKYKILLIIIRSAYNFF